MLRVRITQTDGAVWTKEIRGARIDVGRSANNHVVLSDAAVSSEHCMLELDGDRFVVKDRGSINGTFLNNVRLAEPSPFGEGDRLYVGPYLLELVSVAPGGGGAAAVGRPMGPIVRLVGPRPEAQRESERLRRWADEWEREGRPMRLLLDRAALARVRKRLGSEGAPPPGDVCASYLRASGGRLLRRRLLGVASVLGVVAMLVCIGVGVHVLRARVAEADADVEDEAGLPAAALVEPLPAESAPPVPADTWVEHEVIPAETLDDISRRYDVPVASLCRWNRLNPDDPQIEPGQHLRLKPRKNPLPQQLIVYELDHRMDWRKLSERFGVPVAKLRAYNPELGATLTPGTRVDVWIDPKPYARRSEILDVPEYDIRPDALSVGRPNDGSLLDGIQMPQSDLYTRRAPFIMWGSSQTIKTLQTAIARFRQEVAFDGVVVVADISKRRGGPFSPHKSHQAGRDVDVWMPSLRGVYKRSHLGRERKPKPNEIDWFATWGLIRALIDTGQVLHIFIEYELQEKVYRAAKLMGATDEELARAMQYPRGPTAGGILGHSPGHTGHIHVRFRCGPLDTDCIDTVSRED